MKVIEKGNYLNVFPMRIRCRQVEDMYGFAYGSKVDFCGSELEIEADDIKKHEWSKYPDYSGVDYGVVCPVCGMFVVVDKKTIPAAVLTKAKKIRIG